MYKKLYLALFFVALLIQVSAQNKFWIITPWKQERFRFGSTVMFELKDHSQLDSNSEWCINKEQGIYEMRLTDLKNYSFIFNDQYSVHYKSLKWIFIKTPGRTIKSVLGFSLTLSTFPIYFIDMNYGLAASIFFLPITAILLASSNKFYYARSDEWYPSPQKVEY